MHIVEQKEPRYGREASYMLGSNRQADESSVTRSFLLAGSAEGLTEFVRGIVMSKVLHFVMKRSKSSERYKLQKQ